MSSQSHAQTRTDNSVMVSTYTAEVGDLNVLFCLSSKPGHSLSYKIRRLDFQRLQDYTKKVIAIHH